MPNLEDLPPDVVADAVARAVVAAVAAGGDREAIVAKALGTVRSELGLNAGAGTLGGVAVRTPPAQAQPTWSNGHRARAASNGTPSPGRQVVGRQVVTEDDVRAAVAAGGSELRVSSRAIVTALARDAARDAGLRLVETPEGA